jgi:hypothetical protein
LALDLAVAVVSFLLLTPTCASWARRMDAGKGKAPPVKLAAEAIDPDAIRVLDFGIVLGIDEGGRGY